MHFTTLHEVEDAIRACTKCPLAQSRTHAVPGEGPADATLMLIGEAPGRNEDATGRPFVGSAGKQLEAGLARAGLTRGDVYITSILKCRPPNNRDPKREEVTACTPWLIWQITLIKPRLIITLGRHAYAFFQKHPPFREALGTLYHLEAYDAFLLPMLHPAAILYRRQWAEAYYTLWEKLPHILKEKNIPLRGQKNQLTKHNI